MTEFTPLAGNRRKAWWTLALFAFATLAIGAAHHARSGGTGPAAGSGIAALSTSNGAVSASASLDRTAVLRGEDGLVRMELVLRAERATDGAAPQLPTDLVVVLDRSGSMNGRKILDAHAAIRQLISQLTPEDRFALVTFATTAELAIPLGFATPEARAAWDRAVAGVYAGGGTYMSTGLDLGIATLSSARAAGRSPRAIVISDGLAAEPHAVLRAQAARASAGELTLSAVGVGADFDESLMGALADAGTGNYYYLQDAAQLASVFVSEFETARETVAAGVAVTVEPGAGVQVVDAAGYPLERSAAGATFRPGTLFAGQERRVWISLRVPTDRATEVSLGAIRVDYRDGQERHQLTLDDFPAIACVGDEEQFFANLDADTWAQAVVVDEYNQLRQNVAKLVKGGRKDAALDAIESFRSRNTELNEVVASPSVARQVEAASELEAVVDGAFDGPDAKRKQNLLGKSLHAEGGLDRRVGSRK
jgi:Ca-activated chloride channel family protein